MDKLNPRKLVLAGLLLAALLSLLFALRYGGRPANPAPPEPAAAAQALKEPPQPARAAAVKKKRPARKPAKKRYKRVSPLRDPGEALLGGDNKDKVPSAAGPVVKDK
jgi:hypothetical protein